MYLCSATISVESRESSPPSSPSGLGAATFDFVSASGAQGVAREFFRNKHECYERFGSQAASSYGKQASIGLHLIVACDRGGMQVGGVAIYDRRFGSALPLEEAIGHEPPVADEIRTWANERSVVEFSGLWVSENWRKTGLSRSLLLMAMSAAHHLDASRVVGFSHHHVIDFYRTVGLLPHPKADRFHYPHAPYVSMMVWGDPVGFSTLPVGAMTEVRAYTQALERGRRLEWVP